MYRLINEGMIFKKYKYFHSYSDNSLVGIRVKAKHIVEMNKHLMNTEDIIGCLHGGEDYEWVFFVNEIEYYRGKSNEKRNNRKG